MGHQRHALAFEFVNVSPLALRTIGEVLGPKVQGAK
jgi:hypothetical protein